MKEEKVVEEAYAYTPGLKVKLTTTVSKMRRLPVPGEVHVKVGDKVNHNTIVARTQIKGNPDFVRAAMLLDVVPEELAEYLNKNVGDQVKKDEAIASYNKLFGLVKKSVLSPVNGTIESISGATGQVIIRGLSVPVEVNAYISGKVVEVLPRQGAIIETKAALIQGIFGIGGETHGRIRIAVNSPDEELTVGHIRQEDKGAVLIGGSLVTLDVLRKSTEVGVSCVVAGGVRDGDLTTFSGEEIGVAITGHEEVGLTLIITEGFGKMKMSQHTFNLLKRFEGYMASVNGATQIRAGVLRPEIIIPHEGRFNQTLGDELAAGMVLGTPVRIIREPYFGALGRVVSLPVELQQVETRSYVRVLEVELEDGGVVTVPRANVEIIEE